MAVWGVISTGTAACQSFGGLVAARFFLGFVEAAYFVGATLTLLLGPPCSLTQSSPAASTT